MLKSECISGIRQHVFRKKGVSRQRNEYQRDSRPGGQSLKAEKDQICLDRSSINSSLFTQINPSVKFLKQTYLSTPVQVDMHRFVYRESSNGLSESL